MVEDEARAEKRNPKKNFVRISYVQEAFIAGAEWQNSRPVTAEQVEAACAGFYNDPQGLTSWKRLAEVDPVLADKYRTGMRRALEAAREPSRTSEQVLVNKPLADIVTFWRPGSHDWTWAEEYADIIHTERTEAIRARVDAEGIGFIDYVSPVLLGSDGRVWDGHHRICLAIQQSIPSLMVEIVP